MSNKLKMGSPVSPREMAIENTGYRTKKDLCSEGYWYGLTFQYIEI